MKVTSGVSQGSVLGPILFIAYSAEVINIVEHHGLKAHAFADDLQVYGHGQTGLDPCSSRETYIFHVQGKFILGKHCEVEFFQS